MIVFAPLETEKRKDRKLSSLQVYVITVIKNTGKKGHQGSYQMFLPFLSFGVQW